MTYQELEDFRKNLRAGDLVWYVDDSFDVSIRRIETAEEIGNLSDDGYMRYTLSDHYRSEWEKVTTVFRSDSMFPYPDGRHDVEEVLRVRARMIRDRADEVRDCEDDTYWMDDPVADLVTGKTRAERDAEWEQRIAEQE